MKIKKTFIFSKEDIGYIIEDFLKKRNYGIYQGTMKWIYENEPAGGQLKLIECDIYDLENENM